MTKEKISASSSKPGTNEQNGNASSRPQMSPFAESAYAFATRSESPPRSSLFDRFRPRSSRRTANGQNDNVHYGSSDYDLLYYQDDTVQTAAVSHVAAPSNGQYFASTGTIQHAIPQPLAGASVFIITNTSKSDQIGNKRTLKIMEEREAIGCTIQTMGGRWVARFDDENSTGKTNDLAKTNAGNITHAIWLPGDGEEKFFGKKKNKLSHLSNEALLKLSTCQTMDIPIVKPSWLHQVGELRPDQHWSDVDVEKHVPSIVHALQKENSKWSGHTQVKIPPTLTKSICHSNVGSTASLRRSNSRRDDASRLSASIGDTFQSLCEENPDLMEEEAIKRACELSMLDFALVHQTATRKRATSERGYSVINNERGTIGESAYEILQVDEESTPEEIKVAYKRRALETHPDKGGKPGEFEAVARAYRILLAANSDNALSPDNSFEEGATGALKSTSHWDCELKEHRNLVREMYQNHGQDLDANIAKQNFALERLGLRYRDVGTKNRNEKNELIRNSCFYLSLASSYLAGIGAFAFSKGEVSSDESDEGDSDFDEDYNSDEIDRTLLREANGALVMETALTLKRTIEARVLSAHPEWAAKGIVGEEVEAFSDFLVYTLESQTIISDWAVVVFDTSSGFVDVYRGKNYKDEAETNDDGGVGCHIGEAQAASNTLTLRYTPGHYQPLVPVTRDSARPSLKKIISALDEAGVLYVITDGGDE